MIIDTSILDAYRDFMEEDADEFIQEILGDFYKNSENLLEKLRFIPTEDQLDGFIRAAHTLKSTSATVGATRLSEIAASIEEKGKELAFHEVAPLLPKLNEAFIEAEAKLKEIYS